MNAGPVEDGENSGIVSHLIELRYRLLHVVAAIALAFLVLLPFANDLYIFLAAPLSERLPAGSTMISVQVTGPFLIPFKLSMLLAVVITVPYWLYHVWAFIAPGLYRHEKRMALPLVVSSTLLFYAGMAFAYFVVFPLVFGFIISRSPEIIAVNPDIGNYLDFTMALFLTFGAAFEIPIATVLLVATGATTPEALASKRPYIIIAAFVIGMLLTPPDVISQIMLAVPMWILYESGIIASRLMLRRRASDASTEADS